MLQLQQELLSHLQAESRRWHHGLQLLDHRVTMPEKRMMRRHLLAAMVAVGCHPHLLAHVTAVVAVQTQVPSHSRSHNPAQIPPRQYRCLTYAGKLRTALSPPLLQTRLFVCGTQTEPAAQTADRLQLLVASHNGPASSWQMRTLVQLPAAHEQGPWPASRRGEP